MPAEAGQELFRDFLVPPRGIVVRNEFELAIASRRFGKLNRGGRAPHPRQPFLGLAVLMKDADASLVHVHDRARLDLLPDQVDQG